MAKQTLSTQSFVSGALAEQATHETRIWTELQQQSRAHWEEQGLNTLPTDIWKYIPEQHLNPTEPYRIAPASPALDTQIEHERHFFSEHILIQNNEIVSAKLPTSCELMSLSAALEQGIITDDEVPNIAKIENPFSHINQAWAAEAQVLFVRGSAKLEMLIQCLGSGIMSVPKLFIVIGDESELCIIERYQSQGTQNALNISLTYKLGSSSRVTRAKYHEFGAATMFTSTISVLQASNSTFQSYALIQDTHCGWETLGAEILGSGTTTRCHGLYLLKDKEFYDTHLYVHHAAPETYSQELYKAILFDESRGVFVGRIHVDQGSDNTDAFQSCRALLASNKALMKAQPELEILTDEVRCTHGVAIGQLPPQALHYCQTRCIPRAEAFKLLLKAFVAEVFLSIPEETTRAFLQERVDSYIVAKIKEGAIHV